MLALDEADDDLPRLRGRPPRTTTSAMSLDVNGGGDAVGRSAASNADSDISPDDSPLSNKLMVRMISLANLPAPECRRMSSSGTEDPVRMN